jgi:hypothetical protein
LQVTFKGIQKNSKTFKKIQSHSKEFRNIEKNSETCKKIQNDLQLIRTAMHIIDDEGAKECVPDRSHNIKIVHIYTLTT